MPVKTRDRQWLQSLQEQLGEDYSVQFGDQSNRRVIVTNLMNASQNLAFDVDLYHNIPRKLSETNAGPVFTINGGIGEDAKGGMIFRHGVHVDVEAGQKAGRDSQGMYRTEKPDQYSANFRTATGQLAVAINTSFIEASKYDKPVDQEFQRVASGQYGISNLKEFEDLAINPAVRTGATMDPRAQREAYSQVAFSFSAPGMNPTFVEDKARQAVHPYLLGQAQVSPDQEKYFSAMRDEGFAWSKQGNLRKAADSVTATKVAGIAQYDVTLQDGFKINVQKPSIKYGGVMAHPAKYELDEGGAERVVRMQPGSARSGASYRLSTSLIPGESSPRPYEVRNIVYGPTILPGAHYRYHDPTLDEPDLYIREGYAKVNLPEGITPANIVAGNVKFNLPSKRGEQYGLGRSNINVGSVSIDGQEHELNWQKGESPFFASGIQAISIPQYYNPKSGQWATGGGEDDVSTKRLLPTLMEQNPGIKFVRDANTDRLQYRMRGNNQTVVRARGNDSKEGEEPTGVSFRVGDRFVNYFGAEAKGGMAVHRALDVMSPDDLRSFMSDWSTAPGVNASAGASVLQNIEAQLSKNDYVDWEKTAGVMRKASSGSFTGDGEALKRDVVLQQVMARRQDEAMNQRNLERGIGYIPTNRWIDLGPKNQQNFDIQVDALSRAFQDKQGLKPAQAKEAALQRLRLVPNEGGGTVPIMEMYMTEPLLMATVGQNLVADNATASSSENEIFQQAITDLDPQLAREVGLNTEDFERLNPNQRSSASMLSYLLHQQDARQGRDTSSKPRIRDVSREEMARIDDLRGNEELSNSAYASQIAEILGIEDEMTLPRLGNNLLPNPNAVSTKQYEQYEQELGPLAKLNRKAWEKSVQSELYDDDFIKGVEQSQAQEPLFQHIFGLRQGLHKDATAKHSPFGTTFLQSPFGAISGYSMGDDMLKSVASRISDFTKAPYKETINFLRNTAVPFIANRFPQLQGSKESLHVDEHIPQGQLGGIIGDRWSKMPSPRDWGIMRSGYAWAAQLTGDFDRDIGHGVMGLKRVGKKLMTTGQQYIQRGIDSILGREKDIIYNEASRNAANALVSQAEDLVPGNIDISEKALKKSQTLEYSEFLDKSLGVSQPGENMGKGYNIMPSLRAASQFSNLENADVFEVQSIYSQALDRPGSSQPALSGAMSSARFSGNFNTPDKTESDFLGFSVEQANSEYKKSVRLDTGSGEDGVQVSGMKRFVSEMAQRFTRSIDTLPNGKEVFPLGPRTAASMFARDQEHKDYLEEQLKQTPEKEWGSFLVNDIDSFYQDMKSSPMDGSAYLEEKRQKDIAMSNTIGFMAIAGRASGKIENDQQRKVQMDLASYLSDDPDSLIAKWRGIASADQAGRQYKNVKPETLVGASEISAAVQPVNTPATQLSQKQQKMLGIPIGGTPGGLGLDFKLNTEASQAYSQPEATSISETSSMDWREPGDAEPPDILPMPSGAGGGDEPPNTSIATGFPDPGEYGDFQRARNDGGSGGGPSYGWKPPSRKKSNDVIVRAASLLRKHGEAIFSGHSLLTGRMKEAGRGGNRPLWEELTELNQMNPAQGRSILGEVSTSAKQATTTRNALRHALAVQKYSSYDEDDPVISQIKSGLAAPEMEAMALVGLGAKASDSKINERLMTEVTEFQNSKELFSVYNKLDELGGFSGKPATQREAIRGLSREMPEGKEVINRAMRLYKAVPNHARGTLLNDAMADVAQLGTAVKATSPKLLDEKNLHLDMSQAVEKLGEITKKVTPLIEDLAKIEKKRAEGLETLTSKEEARAKGLEKEIQSLRFDEKKVIAEETSKSAYAKAEQLNKEFLATGDLDVKKRADSMYKLGRSEEVTSSRLLDEEEEASIGPMGKTARALLGGFGLMYARTIGGIITGGLGYGQDETTAARKEISQTGYQSLGISNIPLDQQQRLQNKIASSGIGNNPLLSIQEFGADNPWAREMATFATSTAGTFSATHFLAGSMKDSAPKVASFLTKYATPIALAASAVNTGMDISGRMQDPEGLGRRLGTDFGDRTPMDAVKTFLTKPIDSLAYMGQFLFGSTENFNTTERGLQVSNAISQGYDKGMSYSQLAAQNVSAAQKDKDGNIIGQSSLMTDYELYSGTAFSLLDKGIAPSEKSASATAAFMALHGGSWQRDDERTKRLAEDYELGGMAPQIASLLASGMGLKTKDIYKQDASGDTEFAKLVEDVLLKQESMPEGDKALLSLGEKFIQGLPGGAKLLGIGKQGTEEAIKTIQQYGELSESTEASDAFTSQYSTAYLARKIGIDKPIPTIDAFPKNLSTREYLDLESASDAERYTYEQRYSFAQQQRNQSAYFGRPDVGKGIFDTVLSSPQESQWFLNRAYNMDPIALATVASRGQNLSAMPGARTMNGTTIDASYMAMTDMGLNGRPTGMDWGTSSLQMGSISGGQMAQNIWGNNYQNNANFDQGLIGAMVGGQALGGTITTPDGTQVSSVGGMMGAQLYQAKMGRDYELFNIGLQNKRLDMSVSHQKSMWGIDDQQRNLSHAYQMQQFGFQQESLDMNMKFTTQNMGLNRTQSLLQRGWTREDWQQNDMVRGMQWGWQQEDYGEESRFLTGRSRRKAERDNERATTMHNIEEDKIDKDRSRQEVLWKLEDDRFNIQKKQFEESSKMQQKQLDASRKYYEENFDLQNKQTQLSRKHWEAEVKIQRQAATAAAQHAEKQFKLQQTMVQLSIASQHAQGQLKTIADNGLEAFREKLIQINDLLITIGRQELPSSGGGSTTGGSSGGGSGGGGGSGYRMAHGGNARSGSKLIVNEIGEEEFIPDRNGKIIPTYREGSVHASLSEEIANNFFIPTQSASASQGGGSKIVNIYIGNERLKTFVLDAVQSELEI